MVRRGSLDGAVLDINLRGEMAFAVADALVERGIPVVFSSSYGADVIPERHSGVARCEKPIEPSVIARALFSDKQA